MYKTTSILALGLSLSLAPTAFAQTTQSENQDQTQQQTTEPAESTVEQQAPSDQDPQVSEEPGAGTTDTQSAEQPSEPATVTQGTEEPIESDAETQVSEPAEPQAEVATEQEEPEAREEAVTGQISEVREGAFLAGNIIGADVTSPEGESIGKVSDLLIGPEGRLEGLVIGVGGLLGIGEKHVALGMGSIEMQGVRDPGQLEIVADISNQELEEAEPLAEGTE